MIKVEPMAKLMYLMLLRRAMINSELEPCLSDSVRSGRMKLASVTIVPNAIPITSMMMENRLFLRFSSR